MTYTQNVSGVARPAFTRAAAISRSFSRTMLQPLKLFSVLWIVSVSGSSIHRAVTGESAHSDAWCFSSSREEGRLVAEQPHLQNVWWKRNLRDILASDRKEKWDQAAECNNEPWRLEVTLPWIPIMSLIPPVWPGASNFPSLGVILYKNSGDNGDKEYSFHRIVSAFNGITHLKLWNVECAFIAISFVKISKRILQ